MVDWSRVMRLGGGRKWQKFGYILKMKIKQDLLTD